MGTGNFYNKNASRVYSFIGEGDDSYEYDSQVGYVTEQLFEAGFDGMEGKRYNDHNDLRSFPSRSLADKEIDFYYKGDIWINIRMVALVRSAYYEGCNFDWNINMEIDNQSYDDRDLESIEDLLEHHSFSSNAGMDKILKRNLTKRISKEIAKLTKDIEDVYEKCTEPLVVAARFSNGETIYSKAI